MPSTPSSQPPFGHGVDVRADDHHAVARAAQVGPHVAGLVAVDLRAGRRQLVVHVGAGLDPLVRPADAPRAAGAVSAGQLGDRAQVGDRAGGIERHQAPP